MSVHYYVSPTSASSRIGDETHSEIVGISFALSIILLLVAFNIDWFRTPWNFVIKIWLKKKCIQYIEALRHVPIMTLRIKGYDWSLKLRDALYKCENPTSTAIQNKKHQQNLWREGLHWKIKDNAVEFPNDTIKLEGKQYWNLSMCLPLFFKDEEITTHTGRSELSGPPEAFPDEFLELRVDLKKTIYWREEQDVGVDEGLRAALRMSGTNMRRVITVVRRPKLMLM